MSEFMAGVGVCCAVYFLHKEMWVWALIAAIAPVYVLLKWIS